MSRENIDCNLGIIYIVLGLLFMWFCTALGTIFVYFLCASLSQISVYCPEQMLLFFLSHFSSTFLQILFFASLMFCQYVIGQSLSPASFSFQYKKLQNYDLALLYIVDK